MSDKFTGGEWKVIAPIDPCGNYGVWTEEDGGHYIVMDGPRYMPMGIWGKTTEEARANAILMAAGPNMLKALRMAELFIDTMAPFESKKEIETFEAVQAAIREATEGSAVL